MEYTKIIGRSLIGLTLLSSLAVAAPVGSGTFNLAGQVEVTRTSILFGYNAIGDQLAAVQKPTTGQFSSLNAGDLVNLRNLFLGTGPGQVNPGGSFTPFQFVVIPQDGVDINLTSIPLDMTVPVCTGAGDTGSCRAYAASPIVLTGGPTGTTAALNGTGEAYFAVSPTEQSAVNLRLSANFAGQTIDQVLQQFFTSTPQQITTGFAANFQVTSVPEPSALAALGLGFVSLGIWKKRKAAK